MTNMIKKITGSILFFLMPLLSMAQNDVEMADVLRTNGKIYVVITVLSVILAGLLFLLISIDLRLRKLEK